MKPRHAMSHWLTPALLAAALASASADAQLLPRAAARRGRRAASAGRDQAHAVGARSESVRHASRRPARGARGRGREARRRSSSTNLVPPIRFEVGVAEIPESTVAELRKILEGMRDRRNVRLHLVGHADNQPLSPALAAVFGDNEGLVARARRRGRRAPAAHARCCRPKASRTNGPATSSRSRRMRRRRAARRTAASRSRCGTTRSSRARRSTRCSSCEEFRHDQSLPHRDRLPAALRRRQRAAHARPERRRAAALRRGGRRSHAGVRRADSPSRRQLERPAQRAREVRRLHRRCAA